MSTLDDILPLKQRMAESIIGQEQVIERLLLTLLANGNLLLEGLPGLATTRACATKRNGVMGGKPRRLYKQAMSPWGVAAVDASCP